MAWGPRFLRRRNAPVATATTPALLNEAIDTFTKPMERHASELYPRFVIASAEVRGSQQRVQIVLDDIAALRGFGEEVRRRLEHATFGDLPHVKGADGAIVPRVHKLTVGPWEGTFLVSDDGQQIIGLVFSREPHDYLSLLGDILVAHAKANPTP